MKKGCFILFLLLIVQVTFAKTIAQDNASQTTIYDYTFLPNQWITMPDGVKLSVTYWIPKAKTPGERFGTVLEALPYRKDDSHYTTDYPIQSYLAKHGIAVARLDLRGTGSSDGVLADREYADSELNDLPVVIEKLAKKPWSNGNVGMQGKSWSAFNSIMIGMQRPPALKGILVAHGSEDLYANDIHNIDGALHLDIFTIEIEVDNLLPQPPGYLINNAYYQNRFNQKPWIFEFLKHQQDDEFWEKNRSLKSNYQSINLSVFAMASLLDGYRDFAINIINNVKSPVKVAMGPQNHAWPNANPGPTYEWRQQAVRWWQQILNGKETGILQEPNFLVFMRESVPPDVNLQSTPGSYQSVNWQSLHPNIVEYIPQANHLLATEKNTTAIDQLTYVPSTGSGVLNWWGETTPNMRLAEKGVLFYETKPLEQDQYILGNPKVELEVSANAPLADWIVRLEDVNPDGSISFVTGGLINGAHYKSRTQPESLPVNQMIHLSFPMHFTTWKFAKGHKIRLTVSNAQFPMVWPTPYKMTTSLMVGNGKTKLFLPVIDKLNQPATNLPELEPDELAPDATDLKTTSLTPFTITHDKNGNTIAKAKEAYVGAIHGNIYQTDYYATYKVNDLNPAKATFIGEGIDSVYMRQIDRFIQVKATIKVESDEKYFHTTVTRSISENGKLLRSKKWQENIPRHFQ